MFSTGSTVPHVLIILAVVVVMAALVALWVAALLSISRVDHLTGTERAVWILIVVIAPLLGALAWFAIGRRRAT